MADVYSAIIQDNDYWDGTISWAGELSQANRDSKYGTRVFVTASLFEADRSVNGLAGDVEIGVITGYWATSDTSLYRPNAFVADGCYLECPINNPDGSNPARHNGIFGNKAGAYLLENRCELNTADCKVHGIQINPQTDSETGVFHLFAGYAEISDNLIKASINGNGIQSGNASATGKVHNNIVFYDGTQGAGSEGIYIQNCDAYAVYNNTNRNFNDGIEVDSGDVDAVNNINFDNADDFDGTFNSLDHNASDDGDGTSPLGTPITWADQFVNYTNYDFTPKAEADIIGAGAGPSSDAKVPVLDILGNTRSGTTCTIGAIEYQGAATRTNLPSSKMAGGFISTSGGF